jgi:Carboxypeptidase regulatory-like domain
MPNPEPRDRPAEPDDIEGSPAQTAKIGEIIPYALIALASFLCGIGVLGLMLWKAEALTKLGLIGNLYYIVLFPLGLCAAVFLFGVVRSFARYKGDQYGGTLELGGPIVAFILVVGGGFVLVPKPPSTFPLTVYVHGEASRNDLVLRNSGRVFVDLDGDRQSRSIGENGEAYFPAIPDRFRGQEVPIWVDATGFESTTANQKERVDGASLYLPVRKKSGHVSGRVQDQDGNPISGAELSVAGVLTHSDASGHFELIIPGDKLAQEMDLQAVSHGYKTQTYKVVPNANELTITLPTAP